MQSSQRHISVTGLWDLDIRAIFPQRVFVFSVQMGHTVDHPGVTELEMATWCPAEVATMSKEAFLFQWWMEGAKGGSLVPSMCDHVICPLFFVPEGRPANKYMEQNN
jgi:hypothetical protein